MLHVPNFKQATRLPMEIYNITEGCIWLRNPWINWRLNLDEDKFRVFLNKHNIGDVLVLRFEDLEELN